MLETTWAQKSAERTPMSKALPRAEQSARSKEESSSELDLEANASALRARIERLAYQRMLSLVNDHMGYGKARFPEISYLCHCASEELAEFIMEAISRTKP